MPSQLQGYQLSPQQRRLFLLQDFDRQNSAQCIVQLDGMLNESMLERATRLVIERHDILRTNYKRIPGMKLPVQVVSEYLVPVWNRLDVGHQDAAEQVSTISRVAQQEREAPFDLEHASPVKLTLCTLAPLVHQLIITLAAPCIDSCSFDNLIKEIARFYDDDKVDDEQDELIQYVQFSEWQYTLQEEEQANAGKLFWQQQYMHAEDIQLSDSVHHDESTLNRYGSFAQVLPPEIQANIEQLAQTQNIEEMTILLACWQMLFWRLTQTNTILVGTVFDGRKYDDLAAGIGLYAKYLPLYSYFHQQSRFLEILAELNNQLEEANELQEFIIGDAANDSNGASQDFFLGFEERRHELPTECKDITFTVLKHFVYSEPCSIKLTCAHYHEQALTLEIHYNRNQFSKDYIQRTLERFLALLQAALADPQQLVSHFCIVGASERDYVLHTFNETAADYPAQRCLHQIFEEQVVCTPDNIAVQFHDQTITYQDLNVQANRIAHYLQKRGVGPDVPVAIFLEHGLDLVPALLGILKAGGVYVPLDPGLPHERLIALLQQIQPSVVLTQHSLIERVPEYETACVCLDTRREMFSQESSKNPINSAGPLNLAYIIFTSGSTGSPKGVMIQHQGLSNYLNWCIKTYPLTEGTGTLVHSSIGFDLTITGLFTSLLIGQKVQLLPDDEKIDALCKALGAGENYSLIKLTPAHLAVLNKLLPQDVLASSTRSLVIGGEALYRKTLHPWRTDAPATLLFNEYGPTETVVGCSIYNASIQTTPQENVPIGRPIDNTQLYVLDEQMQPVPMGISGELYIAGAGLARGYFNSPDLTAACFVPHPFSQEPGARMYKTGDLVRMNADKNLEFIGRVDSQIKLRGFRIELSEIEAVLNQHPQVKQCVALLHGTEMLEKHIVAFVVPQSQDEQRSPLARQAELRNYLKEQLPLYMIPAHFVYLETLPLTANGKIHRESLLALNWEKGAHVQKQETERMLSPVEELLLQCWKQVLSREQMEVHENFFDAGGHSLLATQLVARIQQMVGIEVPLRALFDAPTVAKFAQWLTLQLQQQQGFSMPAIVPAPRNQELPTSFAQQRLWFQDQLDPDNAAYSIPAAVRLCGQLDRVALDQALARVIKRHDILRTTFPARRGEPVLQLTAEPTTHLIVLDLTYLAQEEREQVAHMLIQQEAEQAFSLTRGPLLRCYLLQLVAHEEQILLLSMHHIISDGWSMNILVQEVTSIYTSLVQGEGAHLPALSIQYADYALWQRSWLQGDVLQQQLDYWKKQLAGLRPLALPTDYPRPPLRTFQAELQRLQVPDELSQKVVALSQQEGVTLFMILLAMFKILLHYYTGQDDLVVGTNIANRNRAETEGVIGFFVNQLVLRTHLSSDQSFRTILRKVKETALDAYVHQDLPFDLLLKELNPARDLSRTPLFQVKFELEHISIQENTLPNIKIEPVELEQRFTKFDLFLNMVEHDGNLFGSLEYRTDLFRAETIIRLLHLLEAIINQVATQPDILLQEIEAGLAEVDGDNRRGQEKERKQRNAQKLGQARRRTKQQIESD
ncbi:non-ribosomal peptide synthetase [Dictyobacter arantiisoli]|uniref:Carrier domain-containing protein n=1 Tax=Dictyobacter arantiisoli TaxID=2014874 RepID=A0A5A5TBH8_9CHLR|nr:non-ribosomal peptide synthetase [Dictyobacter arantiisoli]GCF08359.1 hypothetical protein KDI_19230 [Dictyobacter arantiisoli]